MSMRLKDIYSRPRLKTRDWKKEIRFLVSKGEIGFSLDSVWPLSGSSTNGHSPGLNYTGITNHEPWRGNKFPWWLFTPSVRLRLWRTMTNLLFLLSLLGVILRPGVTGPPLSFWVPQNQKRGIFCKMAVVTQFSAKWLNFVRQVMNDIINPKHLLFGTTYCGS